MLDSCLETIFDDVRERCGLKHAQLGSVTCTQLAGNSLNLHPHWHALLVDGVYTNEPGKPGSDLVEAPRLEDEDVERVTARIASRVRALLDRRLPEGAERGPGAVERLREASLAGTASLGERAGMRTRRRGGDGPVERDGRELCAQVEGWSVHAATRVEGEDRLGLERLARYILRGPLAGSRLEELAQGRLAYHLPHALSDGTTTLVMEPLELLEKLVAVVPRTGEHLISFAGILGAHAARRAEVIPLHPKEEKNTLCVGGWKGRRLEWAALLERVFATVILVCACGGRRRVLGPMHKGPAARRILEAMGLPTELPPRAAARSPPQGELGFGPGPPDDFDQRLPDAA